MTSSPPLPRVGGAGASPAASSSLPGGGISGRSGGILHGRDAASPSSPTASSSSSAVPTGGGVSAGSTAGAQRNTVFACACLNLSVAVTAWSAEGSSDSPHRPERPEVSSPGPSASPSPPPASATSSALSAEVYEEERAAFASAGLEVRGVGHCSFVRTVHPELVATRPVAVFPDRQWLVYHCMNCKMDCVVGGKQRSKTVVLLRGLKRGEELFRLRNRGNASPVFSILVPRAESAPAASPTSSTASLPGGAVESFNELAKTAVQAERLKVEARIAAYTRVQMDAFHAFKARTLKEAHALTQTSATLPPRYTSRLSVQTGSPGSRGRSLSPKYSAASPPVSPRPSADEPMSPTGSASSRHVVRRGSRSSRMRSAVNRVREIAKDDADVDDVDSTTEDQLSGHGPLEGDEVGDVFMFSEDIHEFNDETDDLPDDDDMFVSDDDSVTGRGRHSYPEAMNAASATLGSDSGSDGANADGRTTLSSSLPIRIPTERMVNSTFGAPALGRPSLHGSPRSPLQGVPRPQLKPEPEPLPPARRPQARAVEDEDEEDEVVRLLNRAREDDDAEDEEARLLREEAEMMEGLRQSATSPGFWVNANDLNLQSSRNMYSGSRPHSFTAMATSPWRQPPSGHS